MVFYVHRSNRTERLVDALAEIVAAPQTNVLAPECIVVSSPGMERWLSMQLAQRVGIWANPQFPFPRKLIDNVMLSALALDASQPTGYELTCMLFSIAAHLRSALSDPRFAEVKAYLGPEASSSRRLALSTRLAELFDQYLTYRPELVLEWAQGDGDDFQAELLRALVRQHGPGHLAARAADSCKALNARARGTDAAPLSSLPERIHLFGLSSLPPLYLDLLRSLALSHTVHLYVLSPSREYFADQAPPRKPRERAGRSGRSRKVSSAQLQLSFADPEFEQPVHPLLSSLGRHAREFQGLLEARLEYRERPEDLYEEPGEDCLLHVLQSDLLGLRMRGDGESKEPRHVLRAKDESISVHACHGPMRELEVLHDQLSHLISKAGVEPHEIIVMTPNISEYAKVIDAVFSQPPLQRPQIPFRIADRGVSDTQPLFLSLNALLEVLQSRFGANQVLDLLGFDLIRERFDIAIDQVDDLRGWIEASEIRWGIDAAHRAQHDQPACDENTWRFGLARLVLGFSTGLAPERLYHGCSPVAIESGQGALLGNFLELCHTLFDLHQRFSTEATASEWSERMRQLVDVMFAQDVDAAERRQLLLALREIADNAARAGYDETFDLTALRGLLERALSARMPAQGFLSAGVTFCQLLPMRSIPFKVLCLVGLNDGVFPKSDTPLTFDKIAHKRQPGDRSRRDDDRQLFLEALLSARERLIITYVGQSQRTNKPLPPSVLVQELIDYVSQTAELPGQAANLTELQRVEALQARLVLRHPLSGASPRYFGADPDPRFFSYAHGSCEAARASTRRGQGQQPEPFAVLVRTQPERPTEISLRDLERCLLRPARAFCQRRLNLLLGDDLGALPEREPFQLDHLERWKIATESLEHALQGKPEASRYEVQRARGRLPHFVSGELEYNAVRGSVAQIQSRFADITRGIEPRSVAVDLELAGLRLRGTLSDIYPDAHVRVQYSKLGSRHELRQFIRYVVLGCLADQHPRLELPARSILVARGESAKDPGLACFQLERGEHAAVLRDMLELFVEASSAPLPLFAHASFCYADKIRKDGNVDAALRAARDQFGKPNGKKGQAKDLPDAYVEQLFGDFDHMLSLAQERFAQTALRLYSPLLQARNTEKGDDAS